jgi:hypothetical protein
MMQEDRNVAFYGTGGTSQSRPQSSYQPDLTSIPEPPVYEPQHGMKEPLHPTPVQQQPQPSSYDNPPLVLPEVTGRPKNFPPCRPMVHHSIKTDIEPGKRMFIRKAYFGWYVHAFCILYNLICMLGAVIKGYTLVGFFVALAAFILGVPISFFVYYLLYNAIRLKSASRFCLWFGCFVLQIAVEGLYAIGIESTGGAGLILMLKAFTEDNIALGTMFGICFGMWLLITIYNVWFFYQARMEYKNLGGSSAATKEVGKVAVNTAYENRGAIKDFAVEHKETIKQVALENKDTIKQVALENKDVIIDFAKDNKEVITQTFVENRQAISRAAVDNRDLIFENQDVVSAVFEDSSKKH